jgi:hypothetical protein
MTTIRRCGIAHVNEIWPTSDSAPAHEAARHLTHHRLSCSPCSTSWPIEMSNQYRPMTKGLTYNGLDWGVRATE